MGTTKGVKVRLILAVAVAFAAAGGLAAGGSGSPHTGQPATPQLPSSPLTFGVFVVRFDSAGKFTLEGQGWPSFKGTWKTDGEQVELTALRPWQQWRV